YAVAVAAEPVRGSVHCLAVRIASLDDLETGRIDPVERRAVIKPDRRQLEEILAMARGHVEVELHFELPVLGGNDRTRIFLRHAHGNLTLALMPGSGVARSRDALVRGDLVRAVVLRLEHAAASAGVPRPPLAQRDSADGVIRVHCAEPASLRYIPIPVVPAYMVPWWSTTSARTRRLLRPWLSATHCSPPSLDR